MKHLLSFFWRLIAGSLQWRILWITHAKFNVGITGVVLNPYNQVLLLDHVYRRCRHWSLPSGWLKAKETAEEGFRREVREETGIDIQVEGLLRIQSGYALRLEVICKSRTDATAVTFTSNEVFEARFFSVDDLPASVPPEHREYIFDACKAAF